MDGRLMCYCGDDLPSAETAVGEPHCAIPCSRGKQNICGGGGFTRALATNGRSIR